jgi:glucose-6-phosphate 1-dehydrogenase
MEALQATKPKPEAGRSGAPAGPCALVIFGAAGDLTKRKLVPALYNLALQKLLPRDFALVGFARGDLDHAGFRAKLRGDLQQLGTSGFDPGVWDALESRLYYVRGDFGDPQAFARLKEQLAVCQREHGTRGNALFYLSTAPEFFGAVAAQLDAAGLVDEAGGWRRVVVEKPFGRDLDSARALNRELLGHLDERQVYRIDHYLGKETVQNILVFRFANGIFEPIWNRRYIDHVQITVAETLGVEKRGGYYDAAGALRDMVPNHIFQLISLVAMEPPISFQADAVRDEQSKALRAIQPFAPEEVLTRTVRGQYGAGKAGSRSLPDYREEGGVDRRSATETFVAMKLAIDNWRWTGVPFYLRVGKAMASRSTEIAIHFKRPPFVLFRDTNVEQLTPNELVLAIQPREGISFRFGAKIPGATLRLGNVEMDFDYAERFGSIPATGYERLLYDAMLGDQTLFQRADMVEASWSVVTPVLDVWRALPPRSFPNYAAGSWGPLEAEQLLERDGRAWRTIES